MKRLIVLSIAIILVLGVTAVCNAHDDDQNTNLEILDEVTAGAEIDLPNLIKLTENSSIGAELGVVDLQQDWEDSAYVMVKYTWRGSLLDFSKKE